MKKIESIKKLMEYTQVATSPYHTVNVAKEDLVNAGFEELSMNGKWELKKGGKYVVSHYASSLFAFTIGKNVEASDGFRIGAAHGDFPGFRLKPNPEIVTEGYLTLNVEGYGGVNLMSWMDRPLSLAGRVALRSDDPFHPQVRLVDLKKPVMTIPNLAVHMNREMNKGVELKKQTDMLPIVSMMGEDTIKEGFVNRLLAEELQVAPEEILDYELQIYNLDIGCTIGVREEFISAPRLDNLTGVEALVSALEEGGRDTGINVIAVFDHEEVGSRSKQGAGSAVLVMLLEKIYHALSYSQIAFQDALADSFLMSVDVSHALHPAHTGKNDPTNKNLLGKGFCIKQASSQSYATDTEAVAVVQQICEKEQIPYQKFVNHSDQVGGGTLGSIASATLPVKTVDIGVPLLAMHSSRELMCAEDQKSMTRFLKAYYSL